MLYYHESLFIPRAQEVSAARRLSGGYSFGNDFYQIWLTSRKLRLGFDPYGEEMTRDIQTGLYSRPLNPARPSDFVDRRVFPYPAFTLLLFWPAAQIPFPIVRVMVLVLLAGLTVLTILLWIRALRWRLEGPARWAIILLTSCSYPVLEGLYAGQIGLLGAFLLALAIICLQRKRLLLAGSLMALATMKPQMSALAIVYLLIWSSAEWRTRRRFVVGLASTLALLVGASLIAMPGWIPAWIHTVLAYHGYTRPPLITEVLTSHLGRASGLAALLLTIAALAAALSLAWRNRRAAADSDDFCFTLALLLAITSVFVLPGQAVYDHLILLPGLFLLLKLSHQLRSAGPAFRLLAGIGIVVVFWPWAAAFVLVVTRVFTSSISDGALSLPIRTAASLPFAVLALVAWAWRIIPSKSRGFA